MHHTLAKDAPGLLLTAQQYRRCGVSGLVWEPIDDAADLVC